MATTLDTSAPLTIVPVDPINDRAAARTARRWAVGVLTALPVLFLVFDAAMKLVSHPEVLKASEQLGLPASIAPTIGAILAISTILYVVPRTAPLGAVLLTGYLGGAVFVHMRIGDPLWTQVFPVVFGGILWLALYLRDPRVRQLVAAR